VYLTYVLKCLRIIVHILPPVQCANLLRRKWSSCVYTDQSFHVRGEHAGMCNDWDNEAVKGSCTMNDQTTRFSENNICESIS
jgi:hypothetical protein